MLTTTLLVAASFVIGQDAEVPAYEHLKDLECFVGTWESKTVMPESPASSASLKEWAGKPILLRINVKWAPGKNAQIVENVFEVPGEVKISETLLRGWDQSVKKIRDYSFTTHEGAWSGTCEKDGDAWVFQYSGFNLDGGQCTGTRTIKFEGKDTFVQVDTNQTINEKPFPDMECQFKRAGKMPQISNYERLKGLEFLVGDWEAKGDDGSTTGWTFNWTDDKNGLQNVITIRAADGRVTMSNMGVFAWDPETRRITNWCVTEKGKQVHFLWAKRADGKWESWPPGSSATWVITMKDKNTWTMEGSGGTQVFKRV